MTRDPVHPGEILGEELDALGLKGTDLARSIGVPPNRIYQILSGKRALTAETALRLGRWSGTSAEFWLNLQKLYELRLAEKEMGDEIARTVERRVPRDSVAA